MRKVEEEKKYTPLTSLPVDCLNADRLEHQLFVPIPKLGKLAMSGLTGHICSCNRNSQTCTHAFHFQHKMHYPKKSWLSLHLNLRQSAVGFLAFST